MYINKIILLLLILIIFVFLLYKLNYNRFEEFENKTEDIDLNKFNEIFDSELIHLPNTIIAFGIDNETWYSYNINNDNDNGRAFPFLNYWINNIHSSINKNKYYFLLCIYDGYRERIQYSSKLLLPYSPSKNEFLNLLEINSDKDKYPILHKNKYIFTFSKHHNDSFSICVPDPHYIEQNGYINTNFKKIDDNYVSFDNKINKCIYRGKLSNGTVYNFVNYLDKNELNQRQYFKKMYDENKIQNINYVDELTSIEEQIKYKYILDIDGFVNTWDATVWKLYSGSVLLKVNSIWEQWFYDGVKEWVHYVPVENDMSDLNEQIQWCIEHDSECKQITQNAKQFVLDKLNMDYVKNETIKSVKNIL